MRIIYFFGVFAMFASCSTRPVELSTGIWRGVLEQQGQLLPFNFEVHKVDQKYLVQLKNAAEKLTLDEVTINGDSVDMVLHIFDAGLRAKVDGNTLKGFYYKNYAPDFHMPFTATLGEDFRFEKATDSIPATDFTGKYSVTFISDKNDTTISVGVFAQKGNHAEGTFLTTMGDYRYLEGNVIGDKLYLSTFDGNHSFLFTATKKDDKTIMGDYWSGATSHESWIGIKDDNAMMPDAESLTFLKPGFEKIEFSFPDLNNNKISLADEKFKNKVVILQIFGTWCPNCMDETKFLSQWYTENKARGVEIVGLAYERKDDFTYASERVKKMKNKLSVPYDFVIAGTNDKKKAAETLPMLNQVLAFPTTIFIGKDGKVKHIRTGFEGPGTGVYYNQFKQRFNEIINELLNENLTAKK